MASGESKQQPAAYASASWKRSGFMKGLGIPTPSGSYEVGCVDVMLACVQEGATSPAEGDPDTILMRLFYPTDTSQASTDDYAKWFPHPKYVGAYSDSQGWKVSGVWSTMMKGLTSEYSFLKAHSSESYLHFFMTFCVGYTYVRILILLDIFPIA